MIRQMRIRAERLATQMIIHFALVAQQQPVYHFLKTPPLKKHSIFLHLNHNNLPEIEEKAFVTSLSNYDQTLLRFEDYEISKEKEIDQIMALISFSFKKSTKPYNNYLRKSSNTRTPVVQKSGIQCYNCKEYGHVSRECQKLK
ncbi:putative ribonuclease H-like domain-containing protein [Tanacetum coccineum]